MHQSYQAAGYRISNDVTVLSDATLWRDAAVPSEVAGLVTSVSRKTIPVNFQKERDSLSLLAQLSCVRNTAVGTRTTF